MSHFLETKPSTFTWLGNIGNLGHKQKPIKTGGDPGTILFGRFADEEKAMMTRLNGKERQMRTGIEAVSGFAVTAGSAPIRRYVTARLT